MHSCQIIHQHTGDSWCSLQSWKPAQAETVEDHWDADVGEAKKATPIFFGCPLPRVALRIASSTVMSRTSMPVEVSRGSKVGLDSVVDAQNLLSCCLIYLLDITRVPDRAQTPDVANT